MRRDATQRLYEYNFILCPFFNLYLVASRIDENERRNDEIVGINFAFYSIRFHVLTFESIPGHILT